MLQEDAANGRARELWAWDNSAMATIDIKQQHTLGREAAKQSAEKIAQKLKRELNADYRWQGETLKFDCPGAQGGIEVGEHEVRVAVDLSFLLRPMKGRIEREIHEYLAECLG
ncbi:diguanylate cyclase [Novimethylophilus kurashikiensis]|uniref:Diguanylate cyclase n=2 Tax=Novimethylophilus kurashikiensis TaxID=1825523 RepID=A0A2R5F3A2_9PROT|nr:diguanylate cyclase [Novimethylophilus kurashikiensis]